MRTSLAVLLAVAATLADPLGAQSLFNSAGMGLPVDALDGRARALGSVGLGLRGDALLPTDPAAAARLLFATGVIAAQPSWVEFTEDGSGQTHYSSGSRFPLMGIAYPVAGGTATLFLTSVLDQHFTGERAVTVDLGGAPVPATDLFEQDGSVSALSLGYSRMLDPATAVGLSLGRYAGTMERQLTRAFEGSSDAAAPYESAGLWSYSGYLITAGASSDLTTALRVAASVTWSTDLGADAREGTQGANGSFDVPLQLRIGASAVLAPGLTVVASGARADWSTLDLGSGAQTYVTNAFGVGLELSQARLLGRQAPLRVGFKQSGLPFSLGSERATERAFSGGLALTLDETDELVLATADFAVERGRRSGGGITENFWRGTVSIRLSSF